MKIKILIVEDDSDIRDLLDETIKNKLPEVKIDCLSSPRAAMNAIENNDYDIVISDMGLRDLQIGGDSVLQCAKDNNSFAVLYSGAGKVGSFCDFNLPKVFKDNDIDNMVEAYKEYCSSSNYLKVSEGKKGREGRYKKNTMENKNKKFKRKKVFAERDRISEPEKKEFLDFIKKSVTIDFAEDFLSDEDKIVNTEKYLDEKNVFQKDFTTGSRLWMRDQLEEYCEKFLKKKQKELGTGWDEIFTPTKAHGKIRKAKATKNIHNKLIAAFKKIISKKDQ